MEPRLALSNETYVSVRTGWAREHEAVIEAFDPLKFPSVHTNDWDVHGPVQVRIVPSPETSRVRAHTVMVPVMAKPGLTAHDTPPVAVAVATPAGVGGFANAWQAPLSGSSATLPTLAARAGLAVIAELAMQSASATRERDISDSPEERLAA